MTGQTAAPHEYVTVETPTGRLRGMHRHGVCVFRGIRYARAQRWMKPEPVAPWPGVVDATTNGPIAPQTSSRIASLLGAKMSNQSEDCLSLNVWTPACDGERRPVMVWLHGGAFVFGSGTTGIYNGRHLVARGGVVVVTINYRLGSLGFLNLSDITKGQIPATGTEGLYDQIAALKFVRDNIASFGGDPANVTIFGESAGAMSIGTLMSLAPAKGLFARAIMQSGAAHIGTTRERAARVAHRFLRYLSITPENAPENAHRLANLPVDQLMRAQLRVIMDSRESRDATELGRELGRMPFQPCIDGELLTEAPIAALRRGVARDIPLLTGTTAEEWKMFSGLLPHFRAMSKKRLDARARATFGDALGTTLLSAHHEGSSFDRYNAMMTAKVFTAPATRLAEAQLAGGAPCHVYRFDWPSPLLGLGACHAIELGFVFGTHNVRPVSRFFGAGPEAEHLSKLVMDAWLTFAQTGTPSGRDLPAWPRYDDKTRAIMRFHPAAAVLNDPLPDIRKIWANVDDAVLGV